jgi:hypothetical protein
MPCAVGRSCLQKSQFCPLSSPPPPDPDGGMVEPEQGWAMKNNMKRKSWGRTILEFVAVIAAVLLVGVVAHGAHLLR